MKDDPTSDLDNKQLIISLKIKTIFRNQDNSYHKFKLIDRVYNHLIAIPNFRTILGVVERKNNLRINFNEFKKLDDEKPDLVQYLNEYSEKQIIIGTMNLLDEENFEILCGKIAQKLCNYAMFYFFKNKGMPYFNGTDGLKSREEFKKIVEECREEPEGGDLRAR